MSAVLHDKTIADGYLRAALAESANTIAGDPRRLADLREEDLRRELFTALAARLPGRARREEGLTLSAFRGVGGFDLLVDHSPGGRVAWLGEVKWAYTTRSKIFEAVWDAVKLCLAAAEYGATRCWLITSAPNVQWASAESRELFSRGTVSFDGLWTQQLIPPGPNGGKTVGDDLLAGGRGNRFTRTPSAFMVEEIAAHPLRPDGEDWSIRAVAVTSAGDWVEEFASAPIFPRVIRQSWLDGNVPGMSEEQFGDLIGWLRLKRWNDTDLAKRVYPLRPSAPGRRD